MTMALLRSAPFDGFFVAGAAALALVSGAVVVMHPDTFVFVLMLDLWLLGYHHVVATYSRLSFDAENRRAHGALVFIAPPLIVAAVVLAVLTVGPWLVATIYLYWQWFHYTRQSYGVARLYERKADPSAERPDRLTQVMLYGVPLWGILWRSHQNPDTFLALSIRCLPTPRWAVDAVAAMALAALVTWAGRELWRRRVSRQSAGYYAYVLSHHLIFGVGYLVIDHIDHGWLVLNVWHNAQYIAIVWLLNTNRFKSGVDPRHRFLSTISQRQSLGIYLFVFLAASTALFTTIYAFAGSVAATSTVALVIFQSINFHHYVVDAVVWKLRRLPVRRHLGVAPATHG